MLNVFGKKLGEAHYMTPKMQGLLRDNGNEWKLL